jgi:hypothetical protein
LRESGDTEHPRHDRSSRRREPQRHDASSSQKRQRRHECLPFATGPTPTLLIHLARAPMEQRRDVLRATGDENSLVLR